ncbi:hypothetical protein RI844_18975 [Thalassotalea fonticola]|uniref:DUF3592 domain-containing protein n=1 Tax=Thalassotalea fonticola TaxID=3065649 RepID=A0ABZ0GPS0_9GAMM|nr:hypothetical protein RI844_18975 [Colwelliaceae bacterium S1-1]
MFNKTKQAAKILILSSLIQLLMGLSTYFWQEVSGEVIDYKNFKQSIPGTMVGRSHIGGYANDWESLNYRYTFNTKEYQSSFVGFYLPFNNHIADELVTNDDKVRVFVFPLFGAVSVVKQGVGYALTLVLLGSGLSLLILVSTGNWRTFPPNFEEEKQEKTKYVSLRKKNRRAIREERRAKNYKKRIQD